MNSLTHRSQQLGACLWLSSIQYYVVQLIVAAGWTRSSGYSWRSNTISDLANTHCGQYGVRLVCSPHHALMNASFILLGLTMTVGALLLAKVITTSSIAKAGFGAMMLAGIGTLLVGLFPENTISGLHITGAALSFVFGNLGMITMGSTIKSLPRSVRLYTLVSGAVGLVSLVLFLRHFYLGIDIGGMERFVAYPQSIWMIFIGIYLLHESLRVKKLRAT